MAQRKAVKKNAQVGASIEPGEEAQEQTEAEAPLAEAEINQ